MKHYVLLAVLLGCGGEEIIPLVKAERTITTDGKWVRDSEGRIVLIQGMNFSGLEFGDFIGEPRGPLASDLDRIASWGHNTIRLPVAWRYIEPTIGEIDTSYFTEQVQPVVDWARDAGIMVVIEMHQYLWSPCFDNGVGAPLWTCDAFPHENSEIGSIEAHCDLWENKMAPDGVPLQQHFFSAWQAVFDHFKDDKTVVGFDFFNEPNGVSCYENEFFATEILHPFYEKILKQMRNTMPHATMFYSPHVIRNLGIDGYVQPIGENVIYSPHLYAVVSGFAGEAYDGNQRAIDRDYRLAQEEADSMNAPFIAAEYGADSSFLSETELYINHHQQSQLERLVGGLAWAYFPGDDTFSVVDESGAAKGNLVEALTRPNARAVAGVPTTQSYRWDTGQYQLTFQPNPQVAAPTIIDTPHGKSVTVEVTGGVSTMVGDTVEVLANSDKPVDVKINTGQ